jgi:hypothetical protein
MKALDRPHLNCPSEQGDQNGNSDVKGKWHWYTECRALAQTIEIMATTV